LKGRIAFQYFGDVTALQYGWLSNVMGKLVSILGSRGMSVPNTMYRMMNLTGHIHYIEN
jgi:hypothetical protein